jgi:hypothetical protein
MPNTPNGKYGFRAWDKPVGVPAQAAMPPQQYIGPFASNQERLLSQSMAINTMSAAEIQEYVRPPLPQVELFPDKFGFNTNEYGIRDIVEMSGRPTQRTDFAQQPNTTESTSRNTLGQV